MQTMDTDLEELSRALGRTLAARGLMLATAESCTGGWVAKIVTDLPGSSAYFECGFVTYTNRAKQSLVGVDTLTLQRHGAVSEPVVREMAEGALRQGAAQVALSVSGVAGPAGGTPAKPVGTVCFAWAGAGRPTRARTHHLPGDRAAVRRQSVAIALQGVLELLRE